MTNREWLESLSDKELANLIKQASTCYDYRFRCEICIFYNGSEICDKYNLEDWLKAERSESK